MPLPGNNTAWPPTQLKPITPSFDEWSAWYEGTPKALMSVYQPRQTGQQRPSGGVRGALQRMWWGRAADPKAERPDQSHIPIAADIARASADLLYAEPPTLTAGNEATQKQLDLYAPDLHNVLAAGAELGAILGGRFHRVTWDRELSDRSFVTTVDADAAVPEFRWGRLVAVTFWHVLESDHMRVIRHLERHELVNGDGLIFHGLYEGTPTSLGQQRPLEEHPATAPLAKLVAADGAIADGRTRGLAVTYIPNQTPQRRWRKDPLGKNLGRSDLDGVEPLMDNLDEAFSSWMRDIRLGKGRIIVPSYMLRDNGPGLGATFDLDREVYDALNIPDPEGAAPQIVAQQFAIRVEEHERTCNGIIGKIVHTAGYSPQSFGLADDGAAMTATEVQARERRSFLTRDRKVRNEKAALPHLLAKMLRTDAAIFKTAGLTPDEPIGVEFGDSIQDSALTLATTAETMFRAKSASTEVRVKLLHPDWDDQQVQDEVRQILSEDATVADPFTIGG